MDVIALVQGLNSFYTGHLHLSLIKLERRRSQIFDAPFAMVSEIKDDLRRKIAKHSRSLSEDINKRSEGLSFRIGNRIASGRNVRGHCVRSRQR